MALASNIFALVSSYSSDSYIRLQFLLNGVKVDLLSGSLAVLGVFVVSRVIKLLSGLRVSVRSLGCNCLLFYSRNQAVSYMPGMRIPFQPLTAVGGVFPTTWWNPGVEFVWLWRSHCEHSSVQHFPSFTYVG
jgi:hypothetical protein